MRKVSCGEVANSTPGFKELDIGISPSNPEIKYSLNKCYHFQLLSPSFFLNNHLISPLPHLIYANKCSGCISYPCFPIFSP